METFQMREFSGADGVAFSAYDATDSLPPAPMDLQVFDVLNTAPAWLTQSERLLLFTLAYSIRPLRYLEIGVLHGGSALIVSKAMDAAGYDGKVILVDPEPQIDPLHWEQMRERAVLLRGRSPQILPEAREVAGGPLDLVFIDAGHSTKAVMRDAEGVFPHLQNGAYLLFHDSYRNEVNRAIDRFAQLHVGAIVDFGTLTREFHRFEPDGGEDPQAAELSCGIRVMQLRKGHGRRHIVDRWHGFGGRLRNVAGAVRRRPGL
jgi:cephalosporin hydroxylase